MFFKSFVVSFCLLMVTQLKAHSRSDIGFYFSTDNEQVFLEVHLTTQTVFDLLYHLKPELKRRESLKLSSYTADYKAYFNEKITIQLNGKERYLEPVTSNLVIHDATIRFLIKDFNQPIASYHITIDAFSFYINPRFTVVFEPINETNAYCQLTKLSNSCSGKLKTADSSETDHPFDWYWVALFALVAMVGLFWVYKRSAKK